MSDGTEMRYLAGWRLEQAHSELVRGRRASVGGGTALARADARVKSLLVREFEPDQCQWVLLD